MSLPKEVAKTPRLVTVEQFPSIDIYEYWEVKEHTSGNFAAIQAGFFYSSSKQSWIFLGGDFRGATEGCAIERGTIIARDDHLVLYPEQYLDDSRVYIACFGRFDSHPTLPEKVNEPCAMRGQTHAYFSSKQCRECGEDYDEWGHHPAFGSTKAEWKPLGPSYFHDMTKPLVQILALRCTHRNRRFFVCLGAGASLRIPGKANSGEPAVPDYLLSYNGADVEFRILPGEDEQELIRATDDY